MRREFKQLFSAKATYDENLGFLRAMLSSLHACMKSVVFVLDDFDKWVATSLLLVSSSRQPAACFKQPRVESGYLVCHLPAACPCRSSWDQLFKQPVPLLLNMLPFEPLEARSRAHCMRGCCTHIPFKCAVAAAPGDAA